MKKMILFRVNAGEHFGSGHFERCMVLARMLRKNYDPYFLVKGDNRIGEILYKESFNFKLAVHGFDQEIVDIRGLRPNLIFLDIMKTPIEFVRAIKEYAPVIDLDDAGSGSEAATLTVYSLPLAKKMMANLDSSKYLIFRPSIEQFDKREYAPKIQRVLVSFGGVDAVNLSSVFIRISKIAPTKLEWIFARGRFNQNRWVEGDYQEIKAKESLFEEIAQADLVVTSFGMTAYEALAIGTPVLLLNPSEYHEKLTDASGLFASLGAYTAAHKSAQDNSYALAQSFTEYIKDANRLAENALQIKMRVDKQGAERMILLIESLLVSGRIEACPVCNRRMERALVRDSEKNIFLCDHCGLMSQQYFDPPAFVYEKEYFGGDYAEQYGKTYLEDRENIDRLGAARLEVINAIYKKAQKKYSFSGANLLDIGCAYGFFLDIARDSDQWNVEGVEVSKTASKYAREHLMLNVDTAGFLEKELPKEYYHAISMWYVIEHTAKINEVIEKIYTSLVRGGIVAISAPNNRGHIGRFHRAKYLAQHPADHFYDFSIPTMKMFLKRYRFKVVRVRVTGIHYETFLDARGIQADSEDGKRGFLDNGFFRYIYGIIAKIFRLGETFEIYAIKK
ncbi:MAG: methyltransferase domain-containing protein [Spirochaetota bacterium]|nr:methyltransferase domain-containing protein [Spirochaetota bacterium]